MLGSLVVEAKKLVKAHVHYCVKCVRHAAATKTQYTSYGRLVAGSQTGWLMARRKRLLGAEVDTGIEPRNLGTAVGATICANHSSRQTNYRMLKNGYSKPKDRI
ncbi:hypothetical protein JYU34_019570 [Plutella xylostella]|uniref:Uncharacterized protein n=1 Tax=Plutella xylostella TaxID=51655 RepID=A0ABQ7PXB7_PLUXY|nr:hypothetical protein JYU34_019570 [Plutella xylostella]